MTFEITPTALTSGSSRHSVGMLNSFFGTNDTVATSALGSFTISSTSVPSGSTISKIVVTSTKSSGSSGNIELFVAKDEDNGDGTFDRYTDSKSWNSSLTFADFGNYNLSPVGNYYVQFESTRYSTGRNCCSSNIKKYLCHSILSLKFYNPHSKQAKMLLFS